jgi:glucose-6-phosphate isomerase
MPTSLPFEISLSLALNGGAPSAKAYEDALGEAARALDELLSARDPLELLTIVDRQDDLIEAARLSERFAAGTEEIFVLGIGGSSLGGEALSRLPPNSLKRTPRVRFFGNLDPDTFGAALDAADLDKTRFLAISKSGGTAETLMQTLTAADAVRKAGEDVRARFAVVTENKPSALRAFAEAIGCPILDHPIGIGGRYSVLSAVGLFPALLMGLDAGAVRAGAKAVIEAARAEANAERSPAAGAALHLALIREHGLRDSVLWSYADRLGTFGAWWRQLWAESLGKGGQGTTPIAAIGPVDQHSRLQLYLDGPGGALFTLISLATAGRGPRVPIGEAESLGLRYLGNKTLGDLVAAEARATAETLAKAGRPVRQIHLGKLDERALGALFMHFMLETIVMGRLTGVDPFDQPAVEEGKILARKYLEGI